MPPRPPSPTIWSISLALLVGAGACDGCRGKKPAASPSASWSQGQATRLASVPPGHELGETWFSADGRHVAFVATKDASSHVYLDAARHGPYQEARRLVFRRGGEGLAFLARRDDKEFVVVDGVEGAGFGGVGTLLASPGGQFVYSAQRDGQWMVVVGAVELAVRGTADPSPAVSADGKWVVFVEQEPAAEKYRLKACSLELKDCRQGGVFDAIVAHRTDRYGGVIHASLRKEGKQAVARVEVDGTGLRERATDWYDEVPLFAASEGGGHLVYLAYREGSQLLFADGRPIEWPQMDSPLEMVASRGGRVLVTAVVGDQVKAFLDGRQAGGDHSGIDFPTFGADGAHYAYAASRGERSLVVVNGEEGPVFDKVVTPRFSPDGTRLVYRARQDGERFVVVADDKGRTLAEHAHHEAVFDVEFSPDGKSVGYGVRSGQDLLWKVEKL